MGKNIFPKLIEVPSKPGMLGYEKKCLFHERLLYQYLIRRMEGWSVKQFLDEEEIDSYALYAISDFTMLFCKDLEETNCRDRLGIICDRNAQGFCFKYRRQKVILPEELIDYYKTGKIKKIIIMSILHENEIIDELLRKGVLLNDMISFVSILYS